MQNAKHVIIVLMLAALAIGVSASPAAAQTGLRGTFTLTVEAYWGTAVLPAGEYKIAMNLDATPNTRIVFLDGEGIHAMILTGAAMPEEVSGHSALQLEENNGVYVVRRLDAGMMGRSYNFLVSKAARMKTDRASASTPFSVPITASAGN